MIKLRFELCYSPKEHKWYIYDEEGQYRYVENIADIPNALRQFFKDISHTLESKLL